MTDSNTFIDRRQYLAATGAVTAGMAGFAGCLGGETGTLATQVTDQPGDIADFDSCVITVVGMWLGSGVGDGSGGEASEEDEDGGTADEDGTGGADDDGATDEDGADDDDGATDEDGADDDGATDENSADDGNATDEDSDDEADDREYFEFDEPQEADLVDLQDEATQLVDERELDTGEYAYLQLDTDGVDATLEGGESATVEVPGNAPLTFNEAFEIRADTRTTFTADFTPVKRGQSGGYLLQPVPDGITVEYDDGSDDAE